jgi:amino-acid N-acetyltransferase
MGMMMVISRSTSPSSRYLLRDAHPEDLADAQALVSRAELPIDGLDEHFGDSYVVAMENGRMVGVAGVEVHGPYGLLRSVCVLPELQGSGLGADMVVERLERARESGLRAVYLLTTTAAGYFPRFGFGAVDRTEVPIDIQESREYSESCPESATVMKLKL